MLRVGSKSETSGRDRRRRRLCVGPSVQIKVAQRLWVLSSRFSLSSAIQLVALSQTPRERSASVFRFFDVLDG